MAVPNWFLMVGAGTIIAIVMAVYSVPKGFILKRSDIAFLGIILVGAGLTGARILFNILHGGKMKGGFAYFGALVLFLIAIWVYSAVKKVKFLELADYVAPFLMLSQAFVRVGCLMAGCCYGKPTHSCYGVIFKSVDNVIRHPTQAYESILLLTIYIIGRVIYDKKWRRLGDILFISLFLYGSGRFFMEFLRTDSPVIFLNLTLAQVTCLSLSFITLFAYSFIGNGKRLT